VHAPRGAAATCDRKALPNCCCNSRCTNIWHMHTAIDLPFLSKRDQARHLRSHGNLSTHLDPLLPHWLHTAVTAVV
jgi:hypothetical protein